MKKRSLEYVYVVSERPHQGSVKDDVVYKGFALDGNAAEAWQRQALNNANVSRVKERVVEMDEYVSAFPTTRDFPNSMFLIFGLEQNHWIVKGYLLCEESTKALIARQPDTLRYKVLERINF